MKRAFLNKIIASTIVTTSLITMAPIPASAAWVKDYQNNWRYTYGNSNAIGWSQINGAWYYFSADGIMQIGVIQINGKIYLLSDSGQMQIGKAIIDGEVYTFSNDGSAIGNKLPSPRRGFDWAGNSVQTFVPNQVMDGGGSPTDPKSSAIEDEKDKQEYSLTYKDDDGDKLKTKNVEKNDKVELYKPTKNGYKFVEWNTRKNGEGTSYDYDDEVKITKDLTLYAQWEDGSESTDSDSKDSESNVSVTDITVLSQNDSDKITTLSGTLQMNVKVLPIDASNKNVTWSVENKTGEATISETGLLTAVANGEVRVKATSKDGSNVIGLYVVTVSGQSSGGSSGSTTGGDPGTSGGTTTSTFEDYTVQSMDATRVNGTSTNPKSYKTLSILRTDFGLQNVNAETLAIQGGKKITLSNCKIKNLKINDADGTLELIVGEGCTIDNIDLEKGVNIISKSKLGTININTDEVITIDSSVGTINVNEVAKIKIASTSSIDNMEIGVNSQNSIIAGEGTIKQFDTDSNVELAVKTIIINKSNIQNLNDRIFEYESLINNAVKIEEATLAVERAEKSELQSDIDTAINLVNSLPDSVEDKRNQLKARINQINTNQSELKKVKAAIEAVEEAEQKAKVLSTELQLQQATEALNAAKTAVGGTDSGLENGADKINLTERITKVQNTIKKVEDLNKLIKAIADNNFTDINEEIFNSAGILGVTSSNLTDIINGLKQLPKVPTIDTALEVQQSVTKIIENIALKEKIESARVLADNSITDAESKVNSMFVNTTTDSAIKVNLGRTEISLAKQKLNQAKDKITNISSVNSVQTDAIKETIASLNDRYNPINVRFIGAVKQLTEKDVKALFNDDGTRLASNIGKNEIDIVEVYVNELLTLAENASIDTTNISRLGDDINKARQLLIQKEQIAKNLWNTIGLSGPSTALSASTIKNAPEAGYVLKVSLLPVNSYVINDSSNELKLNGNSVFTYLDDNKTTAQISLNLNGNPTNIRVPVMIKNSGSGVSAWSYNTSCQTSQALSNKWEETVTTAEGYTFKFTMTYRSEGTNNVFTITMTPQ